MADQTHNPMMASMIHSGEIIHTKWEEKWEELIEGSNHTSEEVIEELDRDLSILWEAHEHAKLPEDKDMAAMLIEMASGLKVQATAL